MIALVLLSLTGCDAFSKARDTLDGVLNPVVVEGIVLGIEPPDAPGLSSLLAGSGYESGTSITVFVADAAEVANIEDAPVAGALVSVIGPLATVEATELAPGSYARAPDGTFVYQPETDWELLVEWPTEEGLEQGTAILHLPVDADFTDQIPMEHTLNTEITLDFTGLGYDAGLVVVLDDDGVAFSNEPRTVREVYDFTHGNGDATTLTIPADTFDTETVYLVGVAGMVNTRAADIDGLNTALSTIMYGKMRFYVVSTVSLPAI